MWHCRIGCLILGLYILDFAITEYLNIKTAVKTTKQTVGGSACNCTCLRAKKVRFWASRVAKVFRTFFQGEKVR